jgi:hypothetical protein
MKADAKYRFEKSPTAKTAYLLTGKAGADIPAVLGEYVRGANKGRQFIYADKTQYQKPGGTDVEYSLYTTNKEAIGTSGKKRRRISGFNLTPENPHRAFGDYGNDALLIEFSKDEKELELYFFKDMKTAAQTIFEKWIAGEVPETVEADALPFPIPETGDTKKPAS